MASDASQRATAQRHAFSDTDSNVLSQAEVAQVLALVVDAVEAKEGATTRDGGYSLGALQSVICTAWIEVALKG